MQPWCRFLEDEMNGKLLTQKDVAKQLGIAPGRVRIYAAEGLLEYIQLPDLNKPRYTQSFRAWRSPKLTLPVDAAISPKSIPQKTNDIK